MALKLYNPTTPSQRNRKSLIRDVSKMRPEKGLLVSMPGAVGRNKGRIAVRRRQIGARKLYRLVDFKREKRDIPARVASIEYDPNRTPNIALLHYADGEKRYILAPEGLKVGMTVTSGEHPEPLVGNAMPLENMPLGSEIHNIELSPGKGGQLVRSAGGSALLLSREGKYANIRLPSTEVKKVLSVCYATIGALGNTDIRNVKIGKAGRSRHLGRRPSVRGVAMPDPHKHPHGGSYKTSGIGMPPKSPWGWQTKGKKTRKRAHTDMYLVSGRKRRGN